jgi:hypothetical protein
MSANNGEHEEANAPVPANLELAMASRSEPAHAATSLAALASWDRPGEFFIRIQSRVA